MIFAYGFDGSRYIAVRLVLMGAWLYIRRG
jgi:hypothetical protein